MYSASALWRRQFWYDFCTLRTTNHETFSACMQGSRGCCPVCVRIPELFVWFPTAVRYANKCCVTSHNTSTGLLGTFQASNIGEWYTKNFSWVALSYLIATLNFWWEFPFNCRTCKCYSTKSCSAPDMALLPPTKLNPNKPKLKFFSPIFGKDIPNASKTWMGWLVYLHGNHSNSSRGN